MSTQIENTLSWLLGWVWVVSLIFGGCCSNVFALESLVRELPESGILITVIQFLVVAAFTLPPHVSFSRPPWFLKTPSVPLSRWFPGILMFFTVNMMNNFAFGYKISVPVHIILRSGGSATTMAVGLLCGKRYSRSQTFGVLLLTIGVVVAAMADASSKRGSRQSPENLELENVAASAFMGFLILFIAQLLSAFMGIYVQNTYALYGPHWHENLFYSHLLSIALSVPFIPQVLSQLQHLSASRAVVIGVPCLSGPTGCSGPTKWLLESPFSPKKLLGRKVFQETRIPSQVINLILNSLTQYACIRGVNLLGARTSALGVTVVLNIRKLVSLLASIWLFNNPLPLGVVLGAVLVFLGAGVYSSGGRKEKIRPTPQKKLSKAD